VVRIEKVFRLRQERERKFREIAEPNSTEFQHIIMNKRQKGSPLIWFPRIMIGPSLSLSSAIRRARKPAYVAGAPEQTESTSGKTAAIDIHAPWKSCNAAQENKEEKTGERNVPVDTNC
jgi:hypothetical protein